ncbi:hypothetical protein Vi05172_g4911 [Venturia inaequalis]|nr:hypothetical protein Vi05172_g4911 [Venturia inaequalis]
MKSSAILVFLAVTTTFALTERAAQPLAPCRKDCPRDHQGKCIACP